MRSILFSAFALVLFLAAGCVDEGPGGAAKIVGEAKHHDEPIPGTTIYIKYGAQESPGTDPALYDDTVTANENAEFEFRNLNKGDYYLYGVGFDSTIGEQVRAGIPVTIARKNESVSVVVPVTE